MLKVERQQKIKEYMLTHKRVTVDGVSRLLKVTPATVRTDFSELEQEGYLVRFHGGATLNVIDYKEDEINNALGVNAVEHDAKGVASVTKDYSDDPDVTKGCRITASVVCHASSAEETPVPDHKQQVRFLKGKGVGTVTLPGLGIPVGEPAVNPTPRKMISDEISRLTHADVDVTISVENGEDIATRTFNPRVGVLDGISILGTSGIVHPLSNDAFIRSIRRELEVAWAIGRREIGLVAGMKSERALKKEKDIRCVHYGNFIGEALKAAHETGFRHATLAIMIGKAVKLAAGNLDTHSHKVVMDKDFLVSTARSLNIDPSPIHDITMARELWDIMPESFFERIKSLCHENCMTVFPQGEIKIILICDTLQ